LTEKTNENNFYYFWQLTKKLPKYYFIIFDIFSGRQNKKYYLIIFGGFLPQKIIKF
jgi:hypothetical protein